MTESFEKASFHLRDLKKKRDEQNRLAQQYVRKRNKLNNEVKRAKQNVAIAKKNRDAHNRQVRILKAKRAESSALLKEKKRTLNSTPAGQSSEIEKRKKELEAAIESQKIAHEDVQNESKRAQEAHNEMVQLSKFVPSNSNRAQALHKEFKEAKKKGDEIHVRFIAALLMRQSSQDILKTMDTQFDVETVHEEVDDQAIPKESEHAKENEIDTLLQVKEGHSELEDFGF